MSLPIIILAGGLGTRLGNLTLSSPKALIEINEQPFIHHQISYLKTQGLNQVVVSIGHMGEKIQNALGNGEKFGLNISYSEDGKKLLGTGGAVAKAASAIDCENFFCHIWRLFSSNRLPKNVQIFSINSQNLQFNGSFQELWSI